MTYTLFVISALLLYVAIRYILHFSIATVAGTFVYGLGLIVVRLSAGIVDRTIALYERRPKMSFTPQALPEKVADYSSFYRLKGLEVIPGLGEGKRPLRIDLDRYHTLVAATSGAGKTTLINGLIAQLVSREEVRKNYDIFILDLKSSPRDYLFLWKPVIAGYFGLDQSGSTQQAIKALDAIIQRLPAYRKSGRRVVIFIDELAVLTDLAPTPELRRLGHGTLMKLSAQLRDIGALLCATQYPHYKVIDRAISSNLERKICLRMDDGKGAELVLRTKPIIDVTNILEGQFILKEPGHRQSQQLGRAPFVQVPNEIDAIVSGLIDLSADNDDRLWLFREAASTLQEGALMPGINKVARGNERLTAESIKVYYRNYAHAHAIEPKIDRKGVVKGYTLITPYTEGISRIQDYIRKGAWQEAPAPIGTENGNGEEE